MRKTTKSRGEKIVKDIKRATRKHYSSEEKIRIVLDSLRGEDSIAELCRREGIAQGIYYKWSKDFMEAGKKRLAGDTARAANTDEGIAKLLLAHCETLATVGSCRHFGGVIGPEVERISAGVAV